MTDNFSLKKEIANKGFYKGSLHRKGILVLEKKMFWPLFIWIYIIEAATFIIKSNTVDNIFQATCCIVMLIHMVTNGPIQIKHVRKILGFYIVLISMAAAQDLLIGNIPALRFELRFFLFMTILVFLDNYLSKQDAIPRWIIIIPIIYGVITTIQCLIVLFMNLTGIPIQTVATYIGKTGNTELIEIHGLSAIKYDGGTLFGINLNRLKSFFVEPSKFSQFLSIPLFFSIGMYRRTRRNCYAIYAFLMTICYIFIISRAGYIGLIGTIILTTFVKKRSSNIDHLGRKASANDMGKIFLAFVVFLICAVLFLRLMVYMSNFFPEFRMLSAGISNESGKATLVRSETVNLEYILEMVKKRPFGYGTTANEVGSSMRWDTNLANGAMYWLAVAGIPGLLVLLLMQFVIIQNYALPAMQSTDPLRVAISQAYFSISIQMLSYGTFISVEYILIIALMIMSNVKRIE